MIANNLHIMATIGPTFKEYSDMKDAIKHNCTWFRLPLGYRTEDHEGHLDILRKAEKEIKTPINILFDFPSERPRIDKTEGTPVSENSRITLKVEDNGAEGMVINGLKNILKDLNPNEHVWFLDGRIIARITRILKNSIDIIIETGTGTLKSGNSLVFPDSNIRYEPVTDFDIRILKELDRKNKYIDWIALSMISSFQDVEMVKQLLQKEISYMPKLMAKIETRAAVNHIEEIVQSADGVMVARGDLGQILPYSELPNTEKKIVDTANYFHKTVFIATQFLEDFAQNGIPQKAELIDLASAKWLGADGIMLGKETVFSKFPMESIYLAESVLKETISLDMKWLIKARNTSSRVIAIEGPDGVGKTTLCNRLNNARYTIIRGVPAEWEHHNMKKRMISSKSWVSSAFYFLSGVIENEEFIQSVDSDIIISDRSVWSSMVVHYKQNPQCLQQLCSMLALLAPHIEFPRKIIVLNPGFEIARKRINQKNQTDRELDNLLPQKREVYDNEIEFFYWLQKLSLNIVFVDTSADEATVTEAVLKELNYDSDNNL